MDEQAIISQLEHFARDPRGFLAEEPPVIVDRSAATLAPTFSQAEVEGGASARARDQVRDQMSTTLGTTTARLDQLAVGRSAILANDRPENLVDRPDQLIRRIDQLDERRLTQGSLEEPPWSSFYWATFLGQIGFRYADPRFPRGEWEVNQRYIADHPPSAVVDSGDAAQIDLLSPAEKYDLLVGDPDFGLTQASWRTGRPGIAHWEGLCHGWAPASYMNDRPRKPVTVLAADGKTRLTFYPVDIKALLCLLWANCAPPYRIGGLGSHINRISGRSNAEKPRVDDIGRLIDPDDLDTNPGTWHQVITNQIGVAGRSFVLDATYSAEVWNQPVFRYQYAYFNPQALHARRVLGADDRMPRIGLAPTWQDARVARSSFPDDLFARFRAPEATAVIGVTMNVWWSYDGVLPLHNENGTALAQALYLYDLELNGQNEIIGGEWYRNRHPDFLWTPSVGAVARSPWDDATTGEWTGDSPPAAWRDAARSAAAHRVRYSQDDVRAEPQPLAKVVLELLRRSRLP
jgi:hypothetical protein